jgi:hypothetical protein
LSDEDRKTIVKFAQKPLVPFVPKPTPAEKK